MLARTGHAPGHPSASTRPGVRFAAALLAALAASGAMASRPPRACAQDEFLLNDDRVSRNQWEPAVARGATGTLVAVWQDGRNGSGSFEEFDIYSLTLRSAFSLGSTLNRRLNDDTVGHAQANPDIAASPAGTYFCVWVDSRNSDRDIYGVTLDTLGVPITPNLRVSDDSMGHEQFAPKVTAVGSDRYFVVWGDGRDGQGEIFGSYRTASGAAIGGNLRISNDPAAGGSYQGDPACASEPGERTLVVWSDGRNGSTFGVTFDIYGQWLDASGTPVGDNFKINDAGGIQTATSPDVAASADGFVVVWLDKRRTGDPGDVWAQRYALDGTPIGANARVNDDAAGNEQRYPHASQSPTGATVVWEDLRGGLGLDSNVEGTIVPWNGDPPGANYRVNLSTPARQGNPEVVWDGFEASIVVWEDLRRGSSDIFAIPMRIDGSARGADSQLNDDAAPFDQRRAQLGKGHGRYFATWTDLRSSRNDLYGQWITAAGARDGPNVLVWIDNFSERPVAASSAVAPSGEALAVVQVTQSFDSGDIRGVLLPTEGGGIGSTISIGDELPSAQSTPHAAGDATGFGVAWLDTREGTPRLYAQRLGLDGSRVGANHPVLSSEPADPVYAFDLVAAPDGGFWLLYAEGADASQRLWLVRLDASLVAAGPPIEVAPTIQGTKAAPCVDVAAGGRVEVIWLGDGPTGSGQVYQRAFAPAGAGADPLAEPLELSLPTAVYSQTSPSLAVDGSFSVVAWAARPSADWSIWIQRIENGTTPNGPALHVDQDLLGADQLQPTVGVDGAGDVLTIWTDGRSLSSGTDILGRVLRFTPTAADEPPEEPPPAPPPVPSALRVGSARPNPFLASLGVPLDVPPRAAGHVRVAVINARGMCVRVLLDGALPAASTTISWDGRDGEGRPSPGGVYWIVVDGGGERHARRVVRLR
ncbi:MAG TPA: hypothetical protein VFS09_12315 [Candidatus Eisenbacteria bacterium]|nr:hypothetical protein [Candidatus Eisenbacteria bacterium]